MTTDTKTQTLATQGHHTCRKLTAARSAVDSRTRTKIAPAGRHRGGCTLLSVLALVLAQPSISLAVPGQLDTTFGTAGKVTTSFGTDSGAGGIAVQKDGKIVIAGSSSNGTNSTFALVRYNTDGSLDQSFNWNYTFRIGGTVATAVARSSGARSVAIQEDGKILVVGSANDGTTDQIALVRYTTDGRLDTTFNGTGKSVTHVGNNSFARAVVVQTDGKILVSGLSDGAAALLRYNPDGTLDTTFHGTGIQTAAFMNGAQGGWVTLQKDGKILLAGDAWIGNRRLFALARYNPDGNLDTSLNWNYTFRFGGTVTTPVGGDVSTYSGVRSVTVQADGKILLAGFCYDGTGASTNYGKRDFAIVRYTSDGRLDTTFNGTGKVTTSFGNNLSLAYSVAVQANGKILVAGDDSKGFAIARYNTDGGLDSSFNSNLYYHPGVGYLGSYGTVVTPFGVNAGAQALAVQQDGKILAAGYGSNDGIKGFIALARYTGDPVASASSRDLNGDGHSDLLFQNSTGQLYEWFLDGSGAMINFTTGSGLTPGSQYLFNSPLPDWKLVARADVNNDGMADLIFQNNAGQIYVWFLDGTGTPINFATGAGLKPGISPKYLFSGPIADFRLVACADVNHDGNSDLIFQNAGGQIYVWFLDGSGNAVNFATGSGLKAGASPTYLYAGTLNDLKIVSCTDLNGDGLPELVFQNTLGQLQVWFLDGTGNTVNLSTGKGLKSNAAPAWLFTGGLRDWKLRAIQDINGDGFCDLVFQNTSGQLYVWFLDGTGNTVDFSTGTGLKTGSGILFNGNLPDWRLH